MNNLKMFCLTMNSRHLNFIKEINYIPVGLGTSNFSKDYFRDNTGMNIAEKNKNAQLSSAPKNNKTTET